MTELLPIYLGHGMYLEPDLVRICIVFDDWAFDYEIIELDKLNK